MPQVEFKHTIPAFEREKTVHALHRAATVMGSFCLLEFVKGKKVTSLFLINYALSREDIWEIGGAAPPFLTSAVDGSGKLLATPGLAPSKESYRTHWIGPQSRS
jgi:hypothetical protein